MVSLLAGHPRTRGISDAIAQFRDDAARPTLAHARDQLYDGVGTFKLSDGPPSSHARDQSTDVPTSESTSTAHPRTLGISVVRRKAATTVASAHPRTRGISTS